MAAGRGRPEEASLSRRTQLRAAWASPLVPGAAYAVGSVEPLWYFGTTSALASASPLNDPEAASQ